MNVTELLVGLRAQHTAATIRAQGDPGAERPSHHRLGRGRDPRLTELDIARKVIAETAPAATEPDPPQTETSTAYQAIVNAFNQHPGQAFRARDLHELLDMPTDEAFVDITRSRLARLLRQGFLTQPGRGRYQNGLNVALHGLQSAQPTAATPA